MSVLHHIRERQPGHSYPPPEAPLTGIDDFANAIFYADPEIKLVAIGVDTERPLFVGIVTAPAPLSNNRRLFLSENSLTDFEFSFAVGEIDPKLRTVTIID
jgi:hypothetical protein